MIFKSNRLAYLEDIKDDPVIMKYLDESLLLNTTGYNKYTDEVLAKLKSMGYDVRKDDTYVRWYLNGKIHRVNGPAVEFADGTREWWSNGKIHRVNGPAIEFADGTKHWYINGEIHREDGPAVEIAVGNKYWWLNGLPKSEEEFNDIIQSGDIPRP